MKTFYVEVERVERITLRVPAENEQAARVHEYVGDSQVLAVREAWVPPDQRSVK